MENPLFQERLRLVNLLKVGDVLSAVVHQINRDKITVRLGKDQLIAMKLSEASHSKLYWSTSREFKVGDKFKVKVTKLDQQLGEINVSRSVLIDKKVYWNPNRFRCGQEVIGKIYSLRTVKRKNIYDVGVEIAPGISTYIQISRESNVKIGGKIIVEIIKYDTEKMKLKLRFKEVKQ